MSEASNELPLAVALLLTTLLAVGTSCNSHPVQYSQAKGAIEHVETVAGGVKAKVDMLWVLDNSSSMCQEQRELRDSFRNFIDALTDDPIDFHLAVTTTHNIYATKAPPGNRPIYDQHLFGPDQKDTEDTPIEPVAEAGQIQSNPNPPIAFSPSCHFKADQSKDGLDKTNIQPIKDQLSQAISCTKKPGKYQGFSDSNNFETLAKCAVLDEPEQGSATDQHNFCENAGKEDSYKEGDLVAEIFPCGQELGKACKSTSDFDQVYRDIPKILTTAEYAGSDGILSNSEKQELKKDFECMSFVGTRGRTFEQGLRNAALAVHPAMTGGPVEKPFEGKSFEHPVKDTKVEVADGTKRPNHGFLRKDATTAVIFLTDENDCSHKGHKILSRTRKNSCGELNCYFPTKEGSQNKDDLLKTSKLYEDFITNLKESRRVDSLGEGDVVVASIHGSPAKYGSPQHPLGGQHEVPNKCGQDGAPSQQELRSRLPVCATGLGTATSGDRFADFLSEVKNNSFATFPSATQTNGALCGGQGDLSGPLNTIGGLIGGAASGCVDHRVLPCQGNSDCPAFNETYDKGHGPACQQWGNSDEKYCASAIRVRMQPTDGTKIEELKQGDLTIFQEYCVYESIGVPTSNGCIVKRSKYDWKPCRGDENDSIELRWTDLGNNQNPEKVFNAFKVEARYTENKQKNVDQTGGGSADAASKAD